MHKFDNRFKVNRIIITNAITVMVVILIVTVLTLITMGYTLTRDGRLAQTGLVQFVSVPSGATVKIDGEQQFSRTSTKAALMPGEHDFSFSRKGYDTWSKKADVHSGRVLWLNYARLIPNQKTVKTVKTYETLDKMNVSPKAQYILFMWSMPNVAIQLVDIRNDAIKVQDSQLAAFFSDMAIEDAQHAFDITDWNEDENKVLVFHQFSGRSEWVLVDLKNPSDSVNITNEYKMGFSSAKFTSNDGNKLWMLENGNLRRADVGNKTVSAVLVSSVLSMYRVSENETLLITADEAAGTRSFSFYKNGNRGASEIYSLDASTQPMLNVVGGEYYSEDYVATSEGDRLQILKGSYPSFGKAGNPLNYLVNQKLEWPIERLELSSNKRFIYAINKGRVYNYDLENNVGRYFVLDGTYSSTTSLRWLDSYMLWTSDGGQLTVYDFDGNNKRNIQTFDPAFDVALTSNGKWLYTIAETSGGYNLQRLKMILE
ncbi:MAG: PEGA domain-containing protein [Candidatus Nomurabacteria bacterium]|jgi:hypothetical protein|nr:PEGA domain-containing protein [Candidatus Nomurabacteria bacterium]